MAENERMIAGEEQEEQDLDLIALFIDILRGIRRYWLGCVALCLVLALLSFIAGVHAYEPEYVCTADFAVQTAQRIDGSDVDGYSFNYSSETATRLSTAFVNLLQSSLMRETVIRDLGLERFESAVSVSALSKSNMFTLKVTDSNPKRAYDVACSIMENYYRVTAGTIGNTELFALTAPSVPTQAVNRLSAVRMVVTGGALGVVLSGLFIFVYALMRSAVRTREDVRAKLHLNCLAVVPQVRFMRGRRRQIVHFKNRKTGADFRESIRSLRASLLKALPQDAKMLMVTSALAGEGKTMTAVNLAGMLAATGSRVLLVDADLHSQSVLNAMGLEDKKRPGLAEVLSGKVSPVQAIRAEEAFRIAVLAGTETSAKAAQLLRSKQLPELCERLKEAYDFIVLDCPACGDVSDAAILGGMVDAAVLVVRQGIAGVPEIVRGIENLTASGVPLLGCVLNGAADSQGGDGRK